MTARERVLLGVFITVLGTALTAFHAVLRVEAHENALAEACRIHKESSAVTAESKVDSESGLDKAELHEWKKDGAVAAAMGIAAGIEGRGSRVLSLDPLGAMARDGVRISLEGSGPAVLEALSFAETAVPGLAVSSVSLDKTHREAAASWHLEITLIDRDAYGNLPPETVIPSSTASPDPRLIALMLAMGEIDTEVPPSAQSAKPEATAGEKNIERPEIKDIPRFELWGSFLKNERVSFFIKDLITDRTFVLPGAPGTEILPSSQGSIRFKIDGREFTLPIPEDMRL